MPERRCVYALCTNRQINFSNLDERHPEKHQEKSGLGGGLGSKRALEPEDEGGGNGDPHICWRFTGAGFLSVC